ncbi:hypothetical protein B0H16DRAFT_1770116 [Mycena metata]|uniref:Uncharacterized protein n=1 Tax=Mycena metata TaxID=1033252 RepID=A0AAD7MTT0_9AGAR|nr:hypothetical protein B0H16DRAFT_1770116 [Mycena metata]
MSICLAVRRLRLNAPIPGHTRALATAVPTPPPRPRTRTRPAPPRLPAAGYYLAAFRALGHSPKLPEPLPLAQRVLKDCTPRQLYAHMHAAFFVPSSASADLSKHAEVQRIDTEEALLITSLRAFMRLQDYPAALVVLRALSLRRPPTSPSVNQKHHHRHLLQTAETTVLTPLAWRIAAAHPRPHKHIRLAQYLLKGRKEWREDMVREPEWIAARILENASPAFVLLPRSKKEDDPWQPVTTVLQRAFCIHGAVTMKSAQMWTDEARKRAQRKAAWEMERVLLEGERSAPRVDTVLLEQDGASSRTTCDEDDHMQRTERREIAKVWELIPLSEGKIYKAYARSTSCERVPRVPASSPCPANIDIVIIFTRSRRPRNPLPCRRCHSDKVFRSTSFHLVTTPTTSANTASSEARNRQDLHVRSPLDTIRERPKSCCKSRSPSTAHPTPSLLGTTKCAINWQDFGQRLVKMGSDLRQEGRSASERRASKQESGRGGSPNMQSGGGGGRGVRRNVGRWEGGGGKLIVTKTKGECLHLTVAG